MPQACPCVVHRNELVSKSTAYRCKRKLDDGTLQRWNEDTASVSDAKEADDEEVSEEEDAASHDQAKSFACQVVEEVVRGRVTVKGVTDLLKILKKPGRRRVKNLIKQICFRYVSMRGILK